MDNTELDLESFNTKKFINEVKKYPCIWNYNDDQYGNRQRRMDAWIEISKMFYNYESRNNDMKEKIELKLFKRWKTLRDSYVRAMTNNQSRKYVYHKELQFLGSIQKNKPRKRKRSECKSTDEDADDGQSSEPMMKIENITCPFADETVPTEPSTILQVSNYPLSEQFDSDKHFLMSLAGEMNRIPEEYKLDAKSEIIEVIKKYRRMSQYQTEKERVSTIVIKRDPREY